MPLINGKRSEYRALRALINEQMDAFESALEAQELPEMHLEEASVHSTDDPTFLPSNELYNSRANLVASLDMMRALVHNPAERLMADSFIHWRSAVLALICKINVADHLQKAGSKGLSIEELSQLTGVHSSKLTKSMRYMASNYYFNEVQEGVFANNRASLLLLNNSPIKAFVSWQTWFSLSHSRFVADVWSDPIKSASEDHIDTAASYAFDWRSTGNRQLWDWAAQHEPERLNTFAAAMGSFGSTGVNGILADYDWLQYPHGATIVDVGGGSGNMLLPILRNFSQFKGILQDRPETIPAGKENFEKNLPSALESQRIEFDGIDFFNPQERIGKEVYLLRWILHDWDDERNVKILEQQAKAMSKTSKLVIM